VGAAYKLSGLTTATVRYGESNQSAQNVQAMPNVNLADDKQKKFELGVNQKVAKEFNAAINYFSRKVVNEKSVGGYNGGPYKVQANSSQSSTATNCNASEVLINQQWNTNNGSFIPCYNQTNSNRSGFELTAYGSFLERSTYRTSWTRFTTLDGTNIALTTPKDIWDLSLSHGFGKYTAFTNMKYVDKYFSASNTAHALGDYTRYDAGISHETKYDGVKYKTTIYGRNLTNKKYETTLGIQDWGRILGIELIASFK
jgi:hypothetical protein